MSNPTNPTRTTTRQVVLVLLLETTTEREAPDARPVVDTTGEDISEHAAAVCDAATGLVLGATVRAPSEPARAGEFFHGSIGFDAYLAVVGSADALRTPRVPSVEVQS